MHKPGHKEDEHFKKWIKDPKNKKKWEIYREQKRNTSLHIAKK